MLALQAMLNQGALQSGMTVEENARRAEAVARENLLLFRELREDEDHRVMGNAFVRAWRKMPLQIWTQGESTSRPWFALKDELFAPAFIVAAEDEGTLDGMTEEIVVLRLAQHVDSLKRRSQLDPEQARW